VYHLIRCTLRDDKKARSGQTGASFFADGHIVFDFSKSFPLGRRYRGRRYLGCVALYGSAAHAALSVGIAPFFGAGNVMYTSLAGHIIYGAVLGAVFYYYTRRDNAADR